MKVNASAEFYERFMLTSISCRTDGASAPQEASAWSTAVDREKAILNYSLDDPEREEENENNSTISDESSMNEYYGFGAYRSTSSLTDRKSCLKKGEVASATASSAQSSVSFHSEVLVREHDVTMGDHPCNTDGLAMTLDWSYAPEDITMELDSVAHSRTSKFSLPRRLSYQERRGRLFQVAAQERNADLNMTFASLRDSIQNPNLQRLIQDVDHDEAQEKLLYEALKRKQSKIIQPPPMTIRW
eukprot:CAMPEP_0172446060 /NCGR_PEP_ID=MMETSP1065-20121228/5746_1 /TAXON_ID=265537 /ORGANISM="Amphiprora paludosa, Strain CCMP125" /LENGTH=243 /DNA_ID=CAMNT_0013197079 /DNA_START=255 /DNA_END=983 /DNA_ORIENTATION=+